MSFNDFMSKIRHWDSLITRWIMRQFYLFQIPLWIIFFVWLFNTLNIIDTQGHITETMIAEKIQQTQSINVAILILILLLNSFWMLYMFNALQGIRLLLKDINYNTGRLKVRDKHPPADTRSTSS